MIRLPKICLGLLALALLAAWAAPAPAAEAKGTIKTVTIDANEFVITDKDAKELTFHLDKDAKVYVNEKEVTLSELQPGDEAKIQFREEGEKRLASEVRCMRK